eukprot:scaffold4746_cov297-Prasinococcus_capsulatus_cf.AAC.2
MLLVLLWPWQAQPAQERRGGAGGHAARREARLVAARRARAAQGGHQPPQLDHELARASPSPHLYARSL